MYKSKNWSPWYRIKQAPADNELFIEQAQISWHHRSDIWSEPLKT